MSKPRFSTICKQAKELMEKIPNKPQNIKNMIENYPKAAEIFFAEGMYWEIYEYDRRYPNNKSSIGAMKIVLDIHKYLPKEVYQAIEDDHLTPTILFLCGRKAERAILNHKDVIEEMNDCQVQISQDMMTTHTEEQRDESLVNVYNGPLTQGERSANKGKIIDLLKETGNESVIYELIPALNNTTFYTTARCNSHHNYYNGALAQHSLGVCLNALSLAGNNIPKDKVILASLLHDLCDVREFRDKDNQIVNAVTGHGRRSRDILERLRLRIDEDVLNVIRYHMGPSKRGEDERRRYSDIWASPLFSVLHVADHMDAGFVHCDDIGSLGAESYISLDCSTLFKNQEFNQLKTDIERLALNNNIQLKQNKYHHTDWNKKRCSLRILELGEKSWNALVPLTKACLNISRDIRECGITLSRISINRNNLVFVAEVGPSLTAFRKNLQDLFIQQGYSSTFTENLTIKIGEISNTIGDTDRFLAHLNQSVNNIKINVDAINLHYYKGIVAGLYYFKKK